MVGDGWDGKRAMEESGRSASQQRDSDDGPSRGGLRQVQALYHERVDGCLVRIFLYAREHKRFPEP